MDLRCYRCSAWPCECADGCTIIHSDCRDALPLIGRFDVLLTDPPYGIQMAKKGAHSSIRDNDKWSVAKWDDAIVDDAIELAIRSATRAMIWGGNFYSHCLSPSPAWLAWIKPEAESGFSLADMELCWTNYDFAARVKRLPRRDGNLHPTQKPVALMSWCIGFTNESELIVDCFMGSGTTLRAAKDAGRRCIGIEIEERYCEIAANRLRQQVLNLNG